jgi:hypothetical protein
MMSDRNFPGARRCRFGARLAALTLCLIASAGVSRAAPSSSNFYRAANFCRVIERSQLDTGRAQGADVPQGREMTLGVILWDEYRRTHRPGDSNGIIGDTPAVLTAGISGSILSAN